MSSLVSFEFEGQSVRSLLRGGEPWWVAGDVCQCLELANSRKATERLDADERDGVTLSDAMGREQVHTIVNEPGLYTLVLSSRKESARRFKRWLTHEVLPALRREGRYTMAGADAAADEAAVPLGLLDLEVERLWQSRVGIYLKVYGKTTARWLIEQSPLPHPPVAVAGMTPLATAGMPDGAGDIALFLGERCAMDAESEVTAEAMFGAFLIWHQANGQGRAPTQTLFGRVLSRLGLQRVKTYRHVKYLGVRLRADAVEGRAA